MWRRLRQFGQRFFHLLCARYYPDKETLRGHVIVWSWFIILIIINVFAYQIRAYYDSFDETIPDDMPEPRVIDIQPVLGDHEELDLFEHFEPSTTRTWTVNAPLPRQKPNLTNTAADNILKLRNCLLKYDNYWDNFPKSLNECVPLYADFSDRWIYLYSHLDTEWEETKYVVAFTDEAHAENCSGLSIGVPGETIAEQMLLRMNYPACMLYGAEPTYKYGQIYWNVGDHLRFGVSATGGPRRRKIWKQPPGEFMYRDMPTKTITQINKEDMDIPGTNIIYYLLIDMPNVEVELLPEFQFGKSMSEPDVTDTVVCQIDVTLYSKRESTWPEELDFDRVYRRLLKNSPFVPVKGAIYANTHRKMTLMNVVNNDCITAFGIDKIFQKIPWLDPWFVEEEVPADHSATSPREL